MKKHVKIKGDGMIEEAAFPAMFKAEMAEVNNLEFASKEGSHEENRNTTRRRHRA